MDEGVPDARAIDIDDPQQASVAVAVAADCFEGHHAAVEQLLQAPRGAVTPRLFAGAARIVRLRCVDIRDADLGALEPDGVAGDHAIVPAADEAEREVRAHPLAGP